MSNEEYIEELLFEAEKLRVREEVLNSCKNLMDQNPKLQRDEAIKFALDNIKLHSGLSNQPK